MTNSHTTGTGDTHQAARQTADQAITSKEQDQLSRAPFANHLAGYISQWKGDYSLVIALHGPWGSGKSSVKNMVLESLAGLWKKEHPGLERPLLEFNPWRWTGQDQLTTAFFNEIGKTIGKAQPTLEARERVSSRWKEYGAILTIGSSISDSIGAVLPYLGVPTFGIPAALSKVLSKAAGLSEAAVKGAEGQVKLETKTLEEIKKEVSEDLSKLEAPILIVMDDIDRLTPEELRLLFGLVKANADFPNLIFLLLFQRERVAESLEKALNIPSGDQYLKKIVQLEFDIPQADQTHLDEMLYAGVRAAFSNTPHDFLENVRWLRLYGRALQDYFQTLRDVYRFNTTLAFHVDLLSKGGILEVNPIDLIALQALRVFEPDIYQAVAQSKQALTIDRDGLDFLTEESHNSRDLSQFSARISAIYTTLLTPGASPLPPAEAIRHERLREILGALFPVPLGVSEEYGYGFPHENQWERERLACHPKMFDIYFSLGTPRGQVSRAQIQELISSTYARDDFAVRLRDFHENGLLMPALRGLAAYLEQIDLAHAVPFLTALFDAGDAFAKAREEPSGTRALYLLQTIVTSLLDRFGDTQNRFSVLTESLQITCGTLLPISVVHYECVDGAFNETQLNTLKGLAAARITARVRDNCLEPHIVVQSYLHQWLRWGKDGQRGDDAEKWILGQLDDDAKLRTFLRVFKVDRQEEYFDPLDGSIEPLLSTINLRLQDLNLKEFSLEEQEGVRRLKQEYKNIRGYIDHIQHYSSADESALSGE